MIEQLLPGKRMIYIISRSIETKSILTIRHQNNNFVHMHFVILKREICIGFIGRNLCIHWQIQS